MASVIKCGEDSHMLIKEKQIEIRKKYGKKFQLEEIADVAIQSGMDFVEEGLGLSE